MKRMVVLTLIGLLVVWALVACQPASSSGTKTSAQPAASYTNISVQELNRMLSSGNKDFPLINVHIPYEGEIPETDAFIPFNEIQGHTDQLPTDKDAKIVLYCRSGNMSAQAAQTLVELGYSNVFNVEGGMNAWQTAGYELLTK
ncbi:MAG: rhodanese-like domain-containing protein [Anaerolineae bacterium]